MNILVLLPVNSRHRAILESSAPGEDFIYTSADAATREQVADADVILGNIDPDMLTACEHLQLLQLQTACYDDYLAAGTVPADAKLSCSVGAYGQAVSEHMFAMVLSMMKRLPGYHDLQREHRWEDLGEYRMDIQALLTERRRVTDALEALGGVEVLPTDTHYFLARLQQGTAAQLKEFLATRHGLLIRDASNFEGLDARYFRIAIQTEEENNLLIEGIHEWIQNS